MMNCYNNIMIIRLGHLKRTTWLNSFGVPLHAWGDALFRSLGFKFRTFIEVDLSTKKMLRGDMARIKIVTHNSNLIECWKKEEEE
ncbi:hypothetical protein TSUD_100770 [Trifolium subterraneum]|uniref:DUF4283 domain-containing protein n=1 Tax=Trifolium subterraneum TaxID=3900 RepID=A0A2Z6P5L3_TRISU|nr:hypothetical protein TSUD_100770 [Trifolium subterraneum]